MKKSHLQKFVVFSILIVIAIVFFSLDFYQHFTLESIQTQQKAFNSFHQNHPVLSPLVFFSVYFFSVAFSLPIATILTLLAGALFGVVYGIVLVSFASAFGASCAFLFSRYLFADWVQKRFATELVKINQGFEKEGAFYLFALRLVPLFPFFLVNITMALVPISLKKFYWVSQLAMLPATAIYVYAGSELAVIESVSDILSFKLILALCLLGLFPLSVKKFLNWFRKKNCKTPNSMR